MIAPTSERCWRVLLLLALISVTAHLDAQVVPVDCISEIAGPTLDFQSGGATLNEFLVPHDMVAVPDKAMTTMVGWVEGNACAPIDDVCGFGEGFTILTSAAPWQAIGLTFIGTILYEDREFSMTAYDELGNVLGSVTRVFDAGTDFDTYNEGAVFLGLASSEPIYLVSIASDGGNVAFDSLTYRPHCDFVGGCGIEFPRGDANDDSVFDISDPVFMLAALFVPGSVGPTCDDASDANDDGVFDISDPVYSLASLFVPGAAPIPPPAACGSDPSDDGLDCASSSCP